jgi:hypothetical protein
LSFSYYNQIDHIKRLTAIQQNTGHGISQGFSLVCTFAWVDKHWPTVIFSKDESIMAEQGIKSVHYVVTFIENFSSCYELLNTIQLDVLVSFYQAPPQMSHLTFVAVTI